MPPSSTHLGIGLSLATAALWAISPMFMASVGRRVGSHHTNLLRLLAASLILLLVVFPVYLLVHPGIQIPSLRQVHWLLLSSMTGMVLGDACFYEGLLRLGPRRAVKLLTLSPVFSLAIAWFWLGERMTLLALAGAALVIAGLMYATMIDPGGAHTKEPGRVTPAGLLFALGAAIGAALGAVLMRRAFQIGTPDLDFAVAAIIRVVAATAVMWTFALVAGDSLRALARVRDATLRNRLVVGTLFGPVGGILCYVSAMKHAPAGLVSTLSAASPLLIIPITAWRYKVRIRPDIIVATLVAIAGVAMISLGA